MECRAPLRYLVQQKNSAGSSETAYGHPPIPCPETCFHNPSFENSPKIISGLMWLKKREMWDLWVCNNSCNYFLFLCLSIFYLQKGTSLTHPPGTGTSIAACPLLLLHHLVAFTHVNQSHYIRHTPVPTNLNPYCCSMWVTFLYISHFSKPDGCIRSRPFVWTLCLLLLYSVVCLALLLWLYCLNS